MTWGGDPEPPAGGERASHAADSTPPAGSSDEERAAQRDRWRRVQASYRRTVRGDRRRRGDARGTVPARAGMHRKPPPPKGDDAA